MKRIGLCLLLILSLIVAPQVKGFRFNATGAVATQTDGLSPAELFKLVAQESEEEIPEHVKPKLAKGEKWVPHIRLDDEINRESRKRIVAELDQVNKDGADAIVIEIDSPGGYVGEGFEITRAIEDSKAPVYCIVEGEADSMGFYILQGCGTRLMTKRSRLMAHEPAMSAQMAGQSLEWLNNAVRLRVLADSMAEHEAAKMKITVDEFKKRVSGGVDWWMGWGEAKKVGAVDGVVLNVRSTIEALAHGKKPRYL